MAEVDPVEAAIHLMETATEVVAQVGSRIAGQHRYGSPWATTDKSIIMAEGGAAAQIDIPMSIQRLQMRIYGPTPAEVTSLYALVLKFARSVERKYVNVTGGKAMIYWFLPVTGPQAMFDAEVGIHYLSAQFNLAHFEHVE